MYCYILRTGSDFLTVLVPLQLDCGVSQVDHQADLSTFVHLVCWIQFFCKSFAKTGHKVKVKGIIEGVTMVLVRSTFPFNQTFAR